jgi:hypothetical protein
VTETPAGTLIRVTVTAGTRRVDLALPGTVPVAELVPELARSVGVLDPLTAHGGYRLVGADGRCLSPGAGLHGQGILDGSVLTVTAGVEMPAPRRYDDPVEALAAALERDVPTWRPEQSRAVGAIAAGRLVGGAAGMAVPRVERGLALPLTTILVAGVLASGLFPRLAISVGGATRARPGPVDAAATARHARRAHRTLTALGVLLGALLIVIGPLAAQLGRWGVGLACAAAAAVLLGSTHQRASAQVMVGIASGLGGLAAVALCVLRLHPTWRPGLAAVLAALACSALVAGEAALRSAPHARRLTDLLESAALLTLLPLLVLAGGLLDHLPRIGR